MPTKLLKSILVTGVAGSGKSLVCDKLRDRGYQAYDIENIEGLFAMINKETGKVTENHDNDNLESVKQSDWICNKEKLQSLMANHSKNLCFYCGTASNMDDLISLFDKVVLLIASPETIRKRLASRKTKDFGNVAEVQEWVLSWKNWWEDHMQEKGAVVINVDQDIDKIVDSVIQKLLPT